MALVEAHGLAWTYISMYIYKKTDGPCRGERPCLDLYIHVYICIYINLMALVEANGLAWTYIYMQIYVYTYI